MNHTPESDFFAAPVEQTGIDVGAGVVELPVRYWRADRFLAIFPADPDRIRAILPSPKLHPLLLAPGRAALAVTTFNFHETSLGRYGEIGIAPLVTESPFAPPMLPLLAERVIPWYGYILAPAGHQPARPRRRPRDLELPEVPGRHGLRSPLGPPIGAPGRKRAPHLDPHRRPTRL